VSVQEDGDAHRRVEYCRFLQKRQIYYVLDRESQFLADRVGHALHGWHGKRCVAVVTAIETLHNLDICVRTNHTYHLVSQNPGWEILLSFLF
jgi:hypothetical protein